MKINTYEIKTPIWHGKTGERSIGIAEFRLPCEVNITYKDSNGDLVYPNTYIVTEEDAKKYPIQQVNKNIALRIIPIAKLKEKDGHR